ncbi:hypothetical protein AEA09_12760 [Lysinibacillus contaminans]|uniref:Uncharacterized protein n=1 Tax=Lysinibacillus contaminans TaxID=1293441 RepID=A0ABR5K3V3_9BACI|nr:hypothetical protein [Lysinibacillus contaminans]KOS69345.1 hypothetical protein AEA09_12760 [Lysinibacillus contaminans]
MKKWGVFMVLALFVVVGILYYSFAKSQFELAEELYDFPVPKGAMLIQTEVTDNRKSFDWSAASGDNGIPLSYKLILKKNGWDQGQIDGTNVVYTKGQQQINLSTATDYLSIAKVE